LGFTITHHAALIIYYNFRPQLVRFVPWQYAESVTAKASTHLKQAQVSLHGYPGT